MTIQVIVLWCILVLDVESIMHDTKKVLFSVQRIIPFQKVVKGSIMSAIIMYHF